MKTEDIVIGKEYFINLDHEKAHGAFCCTDRDVEGNAIVRVTEIYYDDFDHSVFNVVMDNVPYIQSVGIECFIKAV